MKYMLIIAVERSGFELRAIIEGRAEILGIFSNY